ncbi:MAG TPA: 3-dehydroquinate synthase family protein, partial [Thermoanaerobaculia bacterium]|nr:3-dehydroquinate synthase family protein [Thermoanaerobaculia bacterium]
MSAAAAPSLHRTSLRHPQGETAVLIGAGALATEGAALLADRLAGRLVFVVSTRRVMRLHGERLAPLLAPCGRVVTLTVPEGEPAKTVAVASRLWRRLLAAGGRRDSRIVAFGGGSVGDLAGFVAATFLRGVGLVQLPTTLLAQVDASLGGKTAIDLAGAKNAVGVFHHPQAVLADTRLLGTLPVEELRSGLVEAIKMALVLDADLFARIETGLGALLDGDAEALAPVVAAAAAAKIGVVERDPDERDERRVLNLGHTLGHALESALAYRGLRHGEAVAYGLLFALRLAETRGYERAEPALFARTRRLVGALGLPPLPAEGLDAGHLVDLATRDKKARRSGMVWVLPE